MFSSDIEKVTSYESCYPFVTSHDHLPLPPILIINHDSSDLELIPTTIDTIPTHNFQLLIIPILQHLPHTPLRLRPLSLLINPPKSLNHPLISMTTIATYCTTPLIFPLQRLFPLPLSLPIRNVSQLRKHFTFPSPPQSNPPHFPRPTNMIVGSKPCNLSSSSLTYQYLYNR